MAFIAALDSWGRVWGFCVAAVKRDFSRVVPVLRSVRSRGADPVFLPARYLGGECGMVVGKRQTMHWWHW